jgi:hypothetical protein
VGLKLGATDEADVLVELDAFSGRPNPSWRLREAERVQLFGLLRAAKEMAAVSTAPPGLGYRGLVVRIESGGHSETIRIGGGTIAASGSIYRDNDRAVEAFLLDSMPPELKVQLNTVLPKFPR